jgi:hypothetical protein
LQRNSGVRRLLEEVEAPAASAANSEVFRQLRERNRKLEAAVSDVSIPIKLIIYEMRASISNVTFNVLIRYEIHNPNEMLVKYSLN